MKRAIRLIGYAVSALASRRRTLGNVIIFHTGRSGSTVLGDMMDQHAGVVWGGEVFERLLMRAARRQGRGINHLYGHFSLDDFEHALRKRLDIIGGSRIYGLEVQGYHLDMMGTNPRELLERLAPLGFTRIALLTRSSPIRQVASQLVALQRGSHHARRGEKIDRVSVRIDPDNLYVGHRFQSLSEVLDGYDAFWSATREELGGRQVLELNYERDIQEDPQRAYAMLCGFLGLKPDSPTVHLTKTTAYPLHEIIENFDELRGYLSASGRGALFQETAL